MAIKLLENVSFGLVRTNPKLSTNVKLVCDSNYGLTLESFDANSELSDKQFKGMRVSPDTNFSFDLYRFYDRGRVSPDVSFDVFRASSDLNIKKSFGEQYEMTYCMGAEAVNSDLYKEEFGLFAPLWLGKNVPNYFIIFKTAGPVNDNTKDSTITTDDITVQSKSFQDSIIAGSEIIKTFDLRSTTDLGKYIRNHVEDPDFPSTPFSFSADRFEISNWRGIDIGTGGFAEKGDYIWDDFIGKDVTLIEDEHFITDGFKRNNLVCANIMNLYFLFDDKDSDDFSINRYFGFYVNEIPESKIELDGEQAFLRRDEEPTQLPQVESVNDIIFDNSKDFTQTNPNGILFNYDQFKVDTPNYSINGYDAYQLSDYMPKSGPDGDVDTLNSIFYIKDKHDKFYNLKRRLSDSASVSLWEHKKQLRIQGTKVNFKDFTGFQNEALLTTKALINDIPGKANISLEVKGNPPEGDTYFAGLPNRAEYSFKVLQNNANGNTFTINTNTALPFTVDAVWSFGSKDDFVEELIDAWQTSTAPDFRSYALSKLTDSSGNTIGFKAIQRKWTGIDADFTIEVVEPNGTIATSTSFSVNEDIPSSISDNVITANSTMAPVTSEAVDRFFNPNGTPAEVASSMAAAFNNIDNRRFEAVAVEGKIVIISRVTGQNGNNILFGRNRFTQGAHFNVLSNNNYEVTTKVQGTGIITLSSTVNTVVTGASGVDQTYFLSELSVGDRIIIDSNAYPVEAVSSDIFATIQYPGQNTYTGVFDIEKKFIHPEFDLWYLVGGSGNAKSKASVELKRLNSFLKPNRYLRSVENPQVPGIPGYSKIIQAGYYVDEPIYNKTGETIIGFKNFDKYASVYVDDKDVIFRDSLNEIYLNELFKPSVGRFSFFPIRDFDFDFYSTEYGGIKELEIEKKYYSKFSETTLSGDTNYHRHIDTEDFYDNFEFGQLLGVLQEEASSNDIISASVDSEYKRLNENNVKELTTVSRVTPTINKWVISNGGVLPGQDVRGREYRLNVNDSFGLFSFTPAEDEEERDTNSFTHEWYLLQRIPRYYGLYDKSDLNAVFSYFPTLLDVTSTGLKSITEDYFTEYFVVDYQNYPKLVNTGGDDPMDAVESGIEGFYKLNSELSIPETGVDDYEAFGVDKQIRYSVFTDGSDTSHAQTFFRGVKVVIKERVENKLKIDNNIREIKFKESTKYNDYKFSCVLIPHDGEYPKTVNVSAETPTAIPGISRGLSDIEVIANEKYKHITFVIYAKIDDVLTLNGKFIDRTALYALKSKYNTLDGTATFRTADDINIRGAIDLNVGTSNFATGIIKGVPDALGQSTEFTKEIQPGADGKFGTLEVSYLNGSIQYTMDVLGVIDNNTLKVQNISPASSPFYISQSTIEKGTFIYRGGGFNYYQNNLNSLSFADIAKRMNRGRHDKMSFTTIKSDGTVVNNNFTLELFAAEKLVVARYLTFVDLSERPSAQSRKSPGHRIAVRRRAVIQPIFRHSGDYTPKFTDVIKFEDPFSTVTYTEQTIPGGTTLPGNKIKNAQVKGNVRHKNTQFKINKSFATIRNLFYHRVNELNSDGILELNTRTAFQPLYPLIGEIAIKNSNFQLFKSNWDPNYYRRAITKTQERGVIGTKNSTEHKSFYGSKIMKIPDSVLIDVFKKFEVSSQIELDNININEPDNEFDLVFFNDAINNQIIIDIYLEKRLIEYLSSNGVTEFFELYVNPALGVGDLTTLKDDVDFYIRENILPRLKISETNLFILVSDNEELNDNTDTPLINSEVSDIVKLQSGLATTPSFRIKKLDNSNNFNFRLIYNTRPSEFYSIGPSFKIIKI